MTQILEKDCDAVDFCANTAVVFCWMSLLIVALELQRTTVACRHLLCKNTHGFQRLKRPTGRSLQRGYLLKYAYFEGR